MTRARDVGADIVVLTALGLEYDAVRGHLTGTRGHTDANGTRYEVGALRGGRCRVALALIGEGNLAAAALAGRAIEELTPRALMLVGVAGGLADDVAIGDVVVATRIHTYHGGREEAGGFRPRPKGWQLAHGLEQTAREVARAGLWTRLPTGAAGNQPAPALRAAGAQAHPHAVHFKPVVSGDVVLDSRKSPIAALIADYYSDAVAIDMESAGVAEAAHRKDFHNAITIRAISDATDGDKRHADAAGWQHAAAAHAAAFAMALAERITLGPATATPATAVGPCPYRGLAAFREQDAGLFFGRTEMADELAGLASRSRFVAVAGRSGSGKSSLVHAGLVPRMRRHGWVIAAFRPLPDVPAATAMAGGLLPLLRPGIDPVAALSERAAVAAAIAGGRLPELVGDVLARTGANRLLVCVDQFEELVARGESTARDLAELLTQLSAVAARAHVVLTMRTETLDVAVNRLGLGEVTRHSVFLLTPMRSEQLRTAIEAPVAPTGVRFEPGLVERILESAQGAPAALALMEFALTRLWDEQHHGLLTHAAYDGFGGVGGALAGYAEQVWTNDLDDTERGQARRLLVQLVRPDGDDVIRRTARTGELEPDLVPLAHRLATTRLLVTGTGAAGEPTYDLAHAALATHWHRLRDWLSQERDFRAWQEDLRESIRRDEPVRGPRLTHAVRWLREHPHGITAAERDFITTSRRRQRRHTAAWRGGAALIVALLVVATTFAVNLRQRTGELEDELRHNAALALVAQARDYVNGQPDTAALMAVAAFRADPDPAVLANLADEYLRYRATTHLLNPGIGPITEVRVSPDGRVVAALSPAGTVVWRMDRSPPVPERHEWSPRTIELNHDGTLLAGYFAGRIEVRRPDGTVVVLGEPERTATTASSVRFDPTGRRVLAVIPDEGLVVWDIEQRATVPVPADALRLAETVTDQETYQEQVWFGPDQDTIVVAGDDELTVWHLGTSAATTPTRLTGASKEATVSRDGRTAIACVDRELVRWDLTTLGERDRRPLPDGGCPLDAKNPTDRTGRIVSGSSPREGGDDHPRDLLSLLDLEADTTAHAVTPIALPVPAVDQSLTTTATGTRLVTSVGTTVAVIDLNPADFQPTNRLRTSAALGPVFTKDLRLAATMPTRPERVIQLWNAATGEELAQVANPAGGLPLSFSADGANLLAIDDARENLLVFDVPSLRAKAQLPVPTAPGTRQPNSVAFTNLCVDDTPAPDTVAVLHGGLISRFDLRSGTLAGRPIQPWRNEDELWRLARTATCSVRPGRDQIAFEVGGEVEIWDLDSGGWVATLPVQEASLVRDVRFSPDGTLLAVLSADGTVRIWDADRRQPVGDPARVLGTGSSAHIVDFPDGNRIVVQNTEELRVWDLDRGAAIANLEVSGADRVAADAGTLLIWSGSGLVRMPLDPQHWADHLCRTVGRDLTDTERQTLPPGSPTEPICSPS